MNGPRLSIIPARAATDSALKPRDLQVLCLLGRHTDDYGWCRRSQVKMAEELGCARSTVFDAIERLVKAGYLERHVQEEDNGRDSPHIYRVILDPVHPDLGSITGADTPADIPAPPADISAPPAGPGPAPKNDPFRTVERETRAREEEKPVEPDNLPPEDRPETSAFEKRVQWFCSGAGYRAGQWPNWDKGAGPKWIRKQFAKLSPEERAEAERWRDAYLLDLQRRKIPPSKVMGVGNFFNGRAWQGLDPAILDRAEKAKNAALKPEDRARPEGWAKLLGPVSMARLFAELLAGEKRGLSVSRQFISDAELRECWPEIWQFRALCRQQDGIVFGARWHALAGAMEPVPAGTNLLARWKQTFIDRGWVWLGEFDRLDVVFCPIGGPEGLQDFEEALRRYGGRNKGQADDGGRREAAE